MISDTELRDIWANIRHDPCNLAAQYSW